MHLQQYNINKTWEMMNKITSASPTFTSGLAYFIQHL